jgi:hypothetical protein
MNYLASNEELMLEYRKNDDPSFNDVLDVLKKLRDSGFTENYALAKKQSEITPPHHKATPQSAAPPAPDR